MLRSSMGPDGPLLLGRDPELCVPGDGLQDTPSNPERPGAGGNELNPPIVDPTAFNHCLFVVCCGWCVDNSM